MDDRQYDTNEKKNLDLLKKTRSERKDEKGGGENRTFLFCWLCCCYLLLLSKSSTPTRLAATDIYIYTN